jgi:hypothetical protein
MYVQENPHPVYINIWEGIVDNFLIDPHELSARLTCASYIIFFMMTYCPALTVK